MKYKLLLAGFISILIISGIGYAQITSETPIQGRLLNSGNIPLSGTYSLSFTIFDASTGGNQLFTETISSVTVTNGLFSVILGEDPNNPLNLDFSQNYYVEISVNGETLSPRQKLLASPYAISAKNVYGTALNTISDKIGIGTNEPLAKLDIWLNGTQPQENGQVHALRILSSDNHGGLFTVEDGLDQTTGERFGVVLVGKGNNYFPIAFNTNGNSWINGGNVGIGTTNPNTKLVVSDSSPTIAINAENESKWADFRTRSDGDDRWAIGSLGDNNTGGSNLNNLFYIWQAKNKNNQTLNSYRLIINDVGHVGVGTVNPSTALEVAGHVTATGLCLGDDCRQSWPVDSYWTQSGSNINYRTGKVLIGYNSQVPDTPYTQIDSNEIIVGSSSETPAVARIGNGNSYFMGGNIGIGTVNPSNKLHVNGNIGATGWVGAGCEGACESSGGYAVLYPDGRVVATDTGSFGNANSANRGVSGTSSTNYGVVGQSTSNIGVYGISTSSVGTYGISTNSYGAYGQSANNYGVYGKSTHASYGGVLGYTANGQTYGILGHANQYSLYGNGAVYVSGSITSGPITSSGTGGNVLHACRTAQSTNTVFGLSHSVSCNSGEIVTGGGGICGTSTTNSMRASRPSGQGWEVQCDSYQNAGQLTVYAICCQV